MNESISETDAKHLRHAIALSAASATHGSRPFGAVVVAADGTVLGEGRNSTAENGDCTAHAEVNALRAVTPQHGREVLAGATLYASGEPCVMCAGAIFWSNVRRVVFGIDAQRLRGFRRMQAGAGDLEMSCRQVFEAAPHVITVLGPVLADEAAAAHEAYWARHP